MSPVYRQISNIQFLGVQGPIFMAMYIVFIIIIVVLVYTRTLVYFWFLFHAFSTMNE